jgi:hypothetical protein
MPDKPAYDVAERFKEVARRAEGLKKRPNPAQAAPPPVHEETDDEIAYRTRPGAASRRRGDVNLPYEGPALQALKKRQ